MTFTSPALERLRAARARASTTSAAPPALPGAPAPQTQAAPVLVTPPGRCPALPPVQAPPRPEPRALPDMAARARARGHCGTCRHFTPAPDWGRFMGVCGLGWAAHTPWAPSGPLPNSPSEVVIHAAARCMCCGLASHWAARPGVTLDESGGESQRRRK